MYPASDAPTTVQYAPQPPGRPTRQPRNRGAPHNPAIHRTTKIGPCHHRKGVTHAEEAPQNLTAAHHPRGTDHHKPQYKWH